MSANDLHRAADHRPWHREPMLWLVLGLPLLAVAGSLTSAFLAAHGADPEITDNIRHDALAVRADPARDRMAAELGVSAELRSSGDLLEVRLNAGRGTPPPARLVVVLARAAGASLDRMLVLQLAADGSYRTHLPPLAAGRWYVEISPPDRLWRLTGDFTDGADHLALPARPAA
jgi:hypothetical protein